MYHLAQARYGMSNHTDIVHSERHFLEPTSQYVHKAAISDVCIDIVQVRMSEMHTTFTALAANLNTEKGRDYYHHRRL